MKRILSTLSQKWPDYLLEIIVIVIGILGAFALGNWNASTNQAKVKNELLVSLSTEFESNLANLDTAFKYQKILKEACYHWKGLIGSDLELSNKSKESLRNLYYSWTYDPESGALRSGISSGDIHFIQNEELLNLLLGWSDLVEDTKEDELFGNNLLTTALKDLFPKHIRLADQFSSWYNMKPSAHPSDYGGLLDDPAFEDHLALRISYVEDLLYEMKQLRVKNQRILSMIQQELNR